MIAISQNWLLMGLLVPAIWAISCLIDSCLIGERLYTEPFDGVTVSCLFSLLPVFFFTLTHRAQLNSEIQDPYSWMMFWEWELSAFALFAGLAFVGHLWFYFKTLFLLNDVSGAETFLSLSVLVVPLLAWLLLDEVLPPRYYFAFSLAAVGVLLLGWSAVRAVGIRILLLLLASVVAISLSMVWQSAALERTGYVSATLGFNLTCVLVACVLLLSQARRRVRLAKLIIRHPWIILCGEMLGLLAVLSSHRATEYSPSVSFVAMIECLLPVLIVVFSLLLIRLNRYIPVLSGSHQLTLSQQLASVPEKMFAFVLMLLAMVMVRV